MFNTGIDNLFDTRLKGMKVNAKWRTGLCLNIPDRLVALSRLHHRCRQETERARINRGCNQLWCRHPSHSRLDNRIPTSQSFCQAGFQFHGYSAAPVGLPLNTVALIS